ncbi:3761_t:CDS:1, partial [Dentiscutata heterogama]
VNETLNKASELLKKGTLDDAVNLVAVLTFFNGLIATRMAINIKINLSG